MQEFSSTLEKVSEYPPVYSLKKPSINDIRRILEELWAGRISQAAFYYPKSYKMIHVYRDRSGKILLVDTGMKKPILEEVSGVEELVNRVDEPYEVLVFP